MIFGLTKIKLQNNSESLIWLMNFNDTKIFTHSKQIPLHSIIKLYKSHKNEWKFLNKLKYILFLIWLFICVWQSVFILKEQMSKKGSHLLYPLVSELRVMGACGEGSVTPWSHQFITGSHSNNCLLCLLLDCRMQDQLTQLENSTQKGPNHESFHHLCWKDNGCNSPFNVSLKTRHWMVLHQQT